MIYTKSKGQELSAGKKQTADTRDEMQNRCRTYNQRIKKDP
jgi:hypothetical protein